MIQQKEMTAEEFLAFAEQHPDKRFDFVDGELVEILPKRLQGRIRTLLAGALQHYVESHPIGDVHINVLHEIEGQKFIPDVSINEPSDSEYFTTPPIVAVEIRSDSQSEAAQRRKAQDYIAHKTRMVILILPGKAVEVYRLGHQPVVLKAGETLDGSDVLPGFSIPVQKLL